MSDLTETRRMAFRNDRGELFTISRNGGSQNPGFLYRRKGDAGPEGAIHGFASETEIVRALLLDGATARCKNLADRSQHFLRYAAGELTRYEIGAEIAGPLGIPETGVLHKAAPQITRVAVEAAMDAYDAYLAQGTHAPAFDGFREPKDYWVRSTRPRPNPVYPSKPIAGFALGLPQLNGGWSTASSAAAVLLNAGYIITDQNDQPVQPPEGLAHLAIDADRIRLCALNYFVESARESRAATVAIQSGALATAMGLHNKFPNICQSLGGAKFQTLAKLPPPDIVGPDPSSTTVFTFRLSPDAKAPPVSEATPTSLPHATNLILYGPPGTGKTYATAWEAVRLCLGDAAAEAFQGKDRHGALMQEYRRLIDVEKRIEFVTFHQSMSYEEFVEGLRPTTGAVQDPAAPQPEETAAGFRLEPQDGIFKRICRQATQDPGAAPAGGLDRTRRIYRLGLTGNDWREVLAECLSSGEVTWRFGDDIDWSAPEYEDWEAIKQRRRQEDPDVRGNHATVYGTWLIRGAAQDGAYVMLTLGRDQVVAFGRLSGPYRFTPAQDGSPARHTRPVDWLWSDPQGLDRASFYPTAFTSFHPLYPLWDDAIDWPALERAILGHVAPALPRPHVLIIDEVNRANISKVFGELITLLEPDKRIGLDNEIRVTLPYSKTRFGVPQNLHIVATMNTADRSIALLDTALRRRFTFRELMPDPSVLPENVDGINLRRLLRTINERIEYLFDRDHQIGHAYFAHCASRADIASTMRYKVIPLLAEYFHEDWSKVAVVLGEGVASQGAPVKPRFIRREEIPVPPHLGDDAGYEANYRWTVLPEDAAGGGFDFQEFLA